MEPTLELLNGYSDMVDVIKSAGAWFIGSFMMEFVDNYEKLREKNTKNEFIEYFDKEYNCGWKNQHQLRVRINCAIRIIESNMIEDAMNYVLQTNDGKIGCEESKVNAKLLLDMIHSGEQKVPKFM